MIGLASAGDPSAGISRALQVDRGQHPLGSLLRLGPYYLVILPISIVVRRTFNPLRCASEIGLIGQ